MYLAHPSPATWAVPRAVTPGHSALPKCWLCALLCEGFSGRFLVVQMPFRLEVHVGFNSQETIDRGKVKLPFKQFASCLIDRKYQGRLSFEVRLCFPWKPLRGREELTVHARVLE